MESRNTTAITAIEALVEKFEVDTSATCPWGGLGMKQVPPALAPGSIDLRKSRQFRLSFFEFVTPFASYKSSSLSVWRLCVSSWQKLCIALLTTCRGMPVSAPVPAKRNLRLAAVLGWLVHRGLQIDSTDVSRLERVGLARVVRHVVYRASCRGAFALLDVLVRLLLFVLALLLAWSPNTHAAAMHRVASLRKHADGLQRCSRATRRPARA
jgi:hypothetical protein